MEIFKKYALIDKRTTSEKNKSETIHTLKRYDETPLEKFDRIKTEMMELAKELQFSQEKVKFFT